MLALSFFSFFSMVGCKKQSPDAPAPRTPTVVDTTGAPTNPGGTSRTYLALGDSYTIGQSVAVNERFPNQATALLNSQGLSVANPAIIATTGWTTANLLSAVSATPPANNYDFVTLLIGVNNQYQGRSIEEYKTEFQMLLNKAVSYANNQKKHVFVLSIPDYSITPFAAGSDRERIAREIDQFNAAARQITVTDGITYVDITAISRESDPELIATDGLHPSGKQYARWVALLGPLMKASQ